MKEQEGQQYKVIAIGNQEQSTYNGITKQDAKDFVHFKRIKQLLKRDKVS